MTAQTTQPDLDELFDVLDVPSIRPATRSPPSAAITIKDATFAATMARTPDCSGFTFGLHVSARARPASSLPSASNSAR